MKGAIEMNSDLGFMYIAEQVAPEDNTPKNVEIHDKNGIFYVEFDSVLHTFLDMNRNARMYDGKNIMENIRSEKIQSYLADNAWFGEQNHPLPTYKNMELHVERINDIKMDNTSHKIMNPVLRGDMLQARIQTDAGCAAGINMAKKIIQGMTPSFSCRAIARVENINGRPIVNVKRLITYDWVLYPSHKRAKQITSPKFINKQVDTVVTESVGDVAIPLKELLEYAGRKNVNTQVIMESFDISMDSCVGFSKGAEHIIMKDNTNTIYCNLDPKIKKEVGSYLSKLTRM